MILTEEETKIISLIEENLTDLSNLYNYKSEIFVLYEDSSFIYKGFCFGECKGNSIRFRGEEGLYSALMKYCSNHNNLQHIDLYKYFSQTSIVFNMGKRHANSTNQDRMFSCFRGVYLLCKEGEVVYVGQSKNIFNRIGGHRNKEYDEIKFIPIPMGNLSGCESFHIKKHKPKYNIMHNN